MNKPKFLFVCLGNICRSPTAEAVFRKLIEGTVEDLMIDSAGTGDYHIGENPDPRAIGAAQKRGYKMDHLVARQVSIEDFYEYDYILAMDEKNLADLLDMKPPNSKATVKLFLDFAEGVKTKSVPDPYWSGPEGFDLVLDLVENASRGLIKHALGK